MLGQDQRTITLDDDLEFFVWAREKGPPPAWTVEPRSVAAGPAVVGRLEHLVREERGPPPSRALRSVETTRPVGDLTVTHGCQDRGRATTPYKRTVAPRMNSRPTTEHRSPPNTRSTSVLPGRERVFVVPAVDVADPAALPRPSGCAATSPTSPPTHRPCSGSSTAIPFSRSTSRAAGRSCSSIVIVTCAIATAPLSLGGARVDLTTAASGGEGSLAGNPRTFVPRSGPNASK